MKRTILAAVIMVAMGLFSGMQASAEEAVETYSGDFLMRSTLMGDWGGTRNDLAKKGVTFDMSLTQAGMSVISGGKNIGWEYAGRGNLTLNIDTHKMGLWPGGFFTVEVEGNYNKSINLDAGALMPVNTNQLFPTPGSRGLNIPAVTFMQFFSEYAGIVIGKLDTTSGDANEFAHGKGDTQFMNLAFNFNPATLLTVPNSTLGAGVMILPTKDPKAAVISLSVIDSNGKANRSGFDTAFEGNNTYAIEGRVRTNFFGMTGHQLLGVAYSTKEFSSLDQSLRFIIETRAIAKEDGSWAFFYNFDQYLYEPKKGQGIGIFGRFGISDGNPNPVYHFYSIGLGCKGVIPGRPLDSFGVGYYYMDISQPKFSGLFSTSELLRDEQGGEAYYNFAITPWMKLTPDIQFIRPAQKQVIASGKDVDAATIMGLRLQMIF
ncbi:MAG: carbohydrate porin [Nitrospiraceae bacterium]|nr:carbohydrate porin [Nitrospiraceae bacterium]